MDERFTDVRNRFVLRCRDDYKILLSAFEQPGLRSGPAIRTCVHRLAGAAGTFGFAKLGRAAIEAEDALAGGGTMSDTCLLALLEELRLIGVAP